MVWVEGTVRALSGEGLELRGQFGSIVVLQRLGAGATTFHRVSGDGWRRFDPDPDEIEGERVCVETLMDRSTLLALRVFVGVGCGPS